MIEKLEAILKPEYMNDTFTWKSIKDALESLPSLPEITDKDIENRVTMIRKADSFSSAVTYLRTFLIGAGYMGEIERKLKDSSFFNQSLQQTGEKKEEGSSMSEEDIKDLCKDLVCGLYVSDNTTAPNCKYCRQPRSKHISV